jgi:hypothetical protein
LQGSRGAIHRRLETQLDGRARGESENYLRKTVVMLGGGDCIRLQLNAAEAFQRWEQSVQAEKTMMAASWRRRVGGDVAERTSALSSLSHSHPAKHWHYWHSSHFLLIQTSQDQHNPTFKQQPAVLYSNSPVAFANSSATLRIQLCSTREQERLGNFPPANQHHAVADGSKHCRTPFTASFCTAWCYLIHFSTSNRFNRDCNTQQCCMHLYLLHQRREQGGLRKGIRMQGQQARD